MAFVRFKAATASRMKRTREAGGGAGRPGP